MRIPGFVVGGKHLEGVVVAVPHVVTESNILGLNIIELFKYLVDTENDKVYFGRNSHPSIEEPLRCSGIHLLTSDLTQKLNYRELGAWGELSVFST